MSTIACTKNFQIVVDEAFSLVPTAWWKLEEASGNRLDQIGGYILSDTNGNVTSAAGKVNTASLHTSTPGPVQSVLSTPVAISTLNLNPAGISICGWFRFLSGPIADCALFAPIIQWSQMGLSVSFSIQYSVGLWGPGLYAIVGDNIVPPGIGFASVPYVAALSTWNFVVATYDPVTGVITLLLNNSVSDTGGTLLTTADPTFANFVAGAGAPFTGYSFSLDSDGVVSATSQFDEMAAFNFVVTVADKTFLWNGGSGRTYPF